MEFTADKVRNDILSLSESDFVIEYILKTDVWYFSEYLKLNPSDFIQKLDLFKKIVSANLDISFNNVLIVGSGKIGFSLSPTHKLLRKFDGDENKESDIDVAIISEKYFQELWNVFRKEYCRRYIRPYNEIASSVFRGFINEDVLSEVPEIRRVWQEKVNGANLILKNDIPIRHQINYRIYRSWEDLQEYHINGVRKAKEKLNERGV